jgi:hypothetical protein
MPSYRALPHLYAGHVIPHTREENLAMLQQLKDDAKAKNQAAAAAAPILGK